MGSPFSVLFLSRVIPNIYIYIFNHIYIEIYIPENEGW